MNANDIRGHLLARAPWVDQATTVDAVKAGDAEGTVRSVAVAWTASMDNLRAAAKLGCDLFITHEPAFYEHRDAPDDLQRSQEPAATKQRLIDESGMVLLRLHDTWDAWPEIGVRDAWARWLGLGSLIARDASGFCGLHEVAPRALRELAADVARRVAPLGQDGVVVAGDPERLIRRVAAGTGCAVPDADLVQAGADAIVATYDGASQWRLRRKLLDLGVALICVEHGTSEKPGMMCLADYLRRTFPGLAAHYVDADPPSWTALAASP